MELLQYTVSRARGARAASVSLCDIGAIDQDDDGMRRRAELQPPTTERRFWSDDGWGWRTFRNAKWPTFWTSVGPAGKHDYRLRTNFEVQPMPWSWPAEVNFHEARPPLTLTNHTDPDP